MSDSILERLEALAPELPAEIERLEQQKAEIDAHLRRLRKLHADLTGEPVAAKPKARKHTPPKPSSVGAERTLHIAEAMLGFDEPFTMGDVVEVTGIGGSQVHRVAKDLREIEFIGKAGKRPPEVGGKGHGSALWRVLDAHAIDTLRAKVRSVSNGVLA